MLANDLEGFNILWPRNYVAKKSVNHWAFLFVIFFLLKVEETVNNIYQQPNIVAKMNTIFYFAAN